jgi:4-azaleucine resistance transporter AzlC
MDDSLSSNIKQISTFKTGVKAGFPIVIGYFPIGLAFGILSKTTGITLLESIMFSSIVYAGASQFMALTLIAAGTGPLGIILTTFLVNFRHFLMSASLSGKLQDKKTPLIPLIAFGITDETFSVASFSKEKLSPGFMMGLGIAAYSSWNFGTAMGFLIGSTLPESIQASMGIALYAMFIALLTPMAKKSIKVASLAILSGIVNTLLKFFTSLPPGWGIIIAISLVSVFGIFMFDEKEAESL